MGFGLGFDPAQPQPKPESQHINPLWDTMAQMEDQSALTLAVLSRRMLVTGIVLFFVLTVTVYGRSLGNEFVHFDDNILIFENPAVQTLTPASVHWVFSHFDPELYIPLTFVSYQIDHVIGGLHPLVYHLHNLILHTLNALLVVAIGAILTKRWRVGLLCGLLFALHPLHTEAVVWAAARKDVLSSFFALATLVTYLLYRQAGRSAWYIASVLLFLLALLSKVSVLLLPVFLVIIDWYQGRPLKKRVCTEKLPYVFFALILGLVAILGKQSVLADSPLLSSVLMAGKSTVFYLQKLFAPLKLSVIYPYQEEITILAPDFWIPLVILSIFGVFVLLSLRHTKTVVLSTAFFLLFLAPSFTNYAKAGDIFFASDRYAYLPSIGVFLLFALTADWALRRTRGFARSMLTACIVAILGIFGFLSARQSLVWHDTFSLFRNVVALYDYSYLAQNKVGAKLWEQGEHEEAMEHLLRSIALKPNYRAYYNVGLVHLSLGEEDLALSANLNAITLNPAYAPAHVNLGYLFWRKGDLEQAREHLERAVELDPRDLDALTNLAGLEIAQGNLNRARELLNRTLALDPEHPDATALMERL
ncbi:hypothetical protein COU80_01525 [Candidatus Peregrinibacteria bacterium CG10_big_fil_rev_8_21_14_0_10_55_24]|nr:MAG: hypothetical protein COU80_01525 [Candidatus Peregrinibacteria bacterium CG10_big_fil_rev_8_21_14_0_10_55_24]